MRSNIVVEFSCNMGTSSLPVAASKRKTACGAIHLDIEGNKATPINFDISYRVVLDDLDGLEDFGAV